MTETRADYDAGQQPDREAEIRARLKAVPELPDYAQYDDSWGVWAKMADGTRIRIAKITIIAKVAAAAYARLFTNAPADIAYLLDEVERLEAELEQCHIQLAGCAVAAQGGSPTAKPGDYGWSAAYQDVVDLRDEVERLRLQVAQLAEALEVATQ